MIYITQKNGPSFEGPHDKCLNMFLLLIYLLLTIEVSRSQPRFICPARSSRA